MDNKPTGLGDLRLGGELMARVKLIMPLAGTVGGLNFSRNASGSILRIKSGKTNRNTVKQSKNRNSFTQANGGWHTLTDKQKALWHEYSKSFNETGLQSFIRINSVYQKLNSLRTGSSRGIYLNNIPQFQFAIRNSIGTKYPPFQTGFSFFRSQSVLLSFKNLIKSNDPVLAFDMDLLGLDLSISRNYRYLLRTFDNQNIGFIIYGSYGSSQLSQFSLDIYEPLFFSGFSVGSADLNLVLSSLRFGIPANNATKFNQFIKKGSYNYKFKLQFLTQNYQFLQAFDASISIDI